MIYISRGSNVAIVHEIKLKIEQLYIICHLALVEMVYSYFNKRFETVLELYNCRNEHRNNSMFTYTRSLFRVKP